MKIVVGIILSVFLLLVLSFIVLYLIDLNQQKAFNQKMTGKIELHKKSDGSVDINRSAPVIETKEIIIDAPVQRVWNILVNINEWPVWQSEVTKVSLNGLPQKGVAFKWRAGGISFSSMIHSFEPCKFFGWTGTTFGAQAIHNWTFEETGGKTKLIVEESLQGLFPSLFTDKFCESLSAGMIKNLIEIKIAAEK